MKNNNLTFQIFGLLIIISFIIACNGNKSSHREKKHDAPEKHNHKKQSHSAHEFTNKISIEELTNRFESPERDLQEQHQKILQFMGDIRGKTLMDIGAGTGYYTVKFANNGANVIASDVSDDFQNYLKQRIEKDKIKNIELRKIPFDNPLLKHLEADIVFIANTYHHIENRIDYFKKVKNGLKINGELVIVDYFNADLPKDVIAPPIEMRVSVDQIVFELKKAGFTSFEIAVDLLPYHYIIKAK